MPYDLALLSFSSSGYYIHEGAIVKQNKPFHSCFPRTSARSPESHVTTHEHLRRANIEMSGGLLLAAKDLRFIAQDTFIVMKHQRVGRYLRLLL